VIDVVRALVALGVALALGALLDLVFRFTPPTPARWPLRALAALVILYLFQVVPAMLVAVLAVGALARPRSRRVAERAMSPRELALAWLGVAVLAVAATARSPTTLYWDEMVWLAKARLEASSPGALTVEALRVGTSAIPAGYPLFEPLATAALAGYGSETRALVFGAESLTIVAGSLLVLTAHGGRRQVRGHGDRVAAALACACPLVLVHLRSAYVDLELGMLAAALLLLLEARETRAGVVVAIALVAMKDEGIAHLLAVAAVVAVVATARGRKRDALHAALVALTGAACFVAWRARLLSSGVVDADHSLGAPSLARVPEVFRLALVQAGDVLAWGCLWAAVAGVAVAAIVRPSSVDGRARTRLLAVAAQASLLFGAIVASPDRVMDFVHSGTLLPRLLVQLAPMSMLALAAGLAPGEAREGPR
jgi:hypothetical protein